MGSDFQSDVHGLIEYVGTISKLPDYEQIVFVEDDGAVMVQDFDSRVPLALSRLTSMGEYQRVYEQRKKSGLTWINLQCAGLYRNCLVVVVEFSQRMTGANKTSVNFSGPYRNADGAFEWDFEEKFRWY